MVLRDLSDHPDLTFIQFPQYGPQQDLSAQFSTIADVKGLYALVGAFLRKGEQRYLFLSDGRAGKRSYYLVHLDANPCKMTVHERIRGDLSGAIEGGGRFDSTEIYTVKPIH